MSVYVHEDWLNPFPPLTDDELAGLASKVRFDLIDAEIAWAEAESAKGPMSAWNQQEWATDSAPCGTAYCIAGHLAAQYGNVSFELSNDITPSAVRLPDYSVWPIDKFAIGKFGLDEYYADDYDDTDDISYVGDLFSGDNRIEDLKRIRDSIAELEGVPHRYSGAEKRGRTNYDYSH